MSLTDFFIATTSDINNMDISQSPAGKFPTLETKRTDPVKLITLQCIIDGKHFEENVSLLDEMCIRDAGRDGPWLFRIPETICNSISLASPTELERLGKLWATSEEWIDDGATPEDIIPQLSGIAKLAAQAKTEGKSLFLWMSL